MRHQPTCPRCGRLGHPRRLYCSTAHRDADLADAPERVAAVLIQRADRHERRAADLDAEGRTHGAAALRRVAAEWRTRADEHSGQVRRVSGSPGFAVQPVAGAAYWSFVAYCADRHGCGWREECRSHEQAVARGVGHMKEHRQEGQQHEHT